MSFGECVAGASPAPDIFLDTGISRDRGRIRRNRALIVRTHRESTVPRQAFRAFFFPAAPLVRRDPNVCSIDDG